MAWGRLRKSRATTCSPSREPGQTLHYVVHVPTNQEPGLYWYHPHVHGETSFQVGESGMSGAIIVEGLERHLPGLSKMKQRLIVVRATGIGDDVQPQHSNTGPCTTKDHLTVSLNDAVRPDITIAPGEKQFFRLLNATGHKTLRLNIEGEKLELVAIDGFALDTYPERRRRRWNPRSSCRPPRAPSSSSPGPRAVTASSGRFATTPDPTAIRILKYCLQISRRRRAACAPRLTEPLAVGSPRPQRVHDPASAARDKARRHL